MEPENIRFGGGVAETIMHPVVVLLLMMAIAAVMLLPRKLAAIPFLLIAFLLPLGQVLVVGGIHFQAIRILVMAGAARLLMRKFMSPDPPMAGGFNSLDWAFTSWVFFSVAVYSLQYMVKEAFINRVAFMIDAYCAYFVLRRLIQDEEDVRRIVRVLAYLAMVIGMCMFLEQINRLNVFGLLGGHPVETSIREGNIRSQGPFGHAIIAGCVGATFVPLFVLMWKSGESKILAVLGMIGASIMVISTFSSTPLLAMWGGMLGLIMWPLRNHLRQIRWGIVLTLFSLHMVMKAPVWSLIGRMSVIGVSSGYHRYMLVDNFIRRFGEWWLLGTQGYAEWGWSMWDISNGYVSQGITGGLATFISFMAIIVLCFKKIGQARKAVAGDAKKEWFFWAMGSALFAHCSALFGTGYWDQSQFYWFVFVALVSAATLRPSVSKSPVQNRPRYWGLQHRVHEKELVGV